MIYIYYGCLEIGKNNSKLIASMYKYFYIFV